MRFFSDDDTRPGRRVFERMIAVRLFGSLVEYGVFGFF